MSDEPTLADELRARACPTGLPHTGDDPASDHGHTDCWLFHRAAARIAELEAAIRQFDVAFGTGNSEQLREATNLLLDLSRGVERGTDE